jgi:hypothetical protein
MKQRFKWIMTKIFTKCEKLKDRSEFHTHAGAADGLQAKGKACRSADAVAYRPVPTEKAIRGCSEEELTESRYVVDRWRMDNNHHRPRLDWLTPATYAGQCAVGSPVQLLSQQPLPEAATKEPDL